MPPAPAITQETLQGLLDRYEDLRSQCNASTDLEKRRALRAQGEELAERIRDLENLQLSSLSPELTTALLEVRKADVRLQNAMKEISDSAALMQNVTSLLAAIDHAVVLARAVV